MSSEAIKKTRSQEMTLDPTHYPKAPIKEAIIDIRVKLPESTSLANLSRAYHSVEDTYPTRSDVYFLKGQISAGLQVAAAATQTQGGYRYTSKDNIHIFQCRLDGFTFSRLAPYDRWETFRDEARRLWNFYRSALHPSEIERVAVRYINQINIPGEGAELKEYFRTGPEISTDLDQTLEAYFMQLFIPQPALEGTLAITQTIVPPNTPNTVSILLDIDLFRDKGISSDERKMWEIIELFRIRKNQIFEACITDKTRGLFN